MDNLIRSTEENQNERIIVVAISTLIAVVIILISLTIKYRKHFVSIGFILALFSPYIIAILLGLFFFYLKYYNSKLGNTVISEREYHGSRGGGYQVHKTTLMDVILYIFIAGCILLSIYTVILFIIGCLWIFRDSDEVAPN